MKIKCGTQLYTFRNKIKSVEDFSEVLAACSTYGCTCAQLSGVNLKVPYSELKKIGEDNGIVIPITHTSFDRIVNDTERVAEEHLELGAHSVGLGMMPQKYIKNVSALNEFIEISNKVSQTLKPYGLTFAYHNHNMEFKKMDGKLAIERLMEGNPDLQFIFDTFWCRYAKQDPVAWIEKLNGRVRDIHLKDWKPSIIKFPRFQDVGKGKLDFEAILSVAEKSGTEFAYIEHDLTSDPHKTTRESMEHLRKIYIK